MNLLPVVDPSLLIYREEDFLKNKSQFLFNINKLILYANFLRKEKIKIAMTDSYMDLITNSFPWNRGASNINELRDIRDNIFEFFENKSLFIEKKMDGNIEIHPSNIVCIGINKKSIIESFKELIVSLPTEDFETFILTKTIPLITAHILTITFTQHQTKIELPIIPDQNILEKQIIYQVLSDNPAIILPQDRYGKFEDFEPIDVGGTPGSILLIEDRS